MIVIAEGAVDGLIESEKEIMYDKMGIKKEEMVKDESGNVKSVVRRFVYSTPVNILYRTLLRLLRVTWVSTRRLSTIPS